MHEIIIKKLWTHGLYLFCLYCPSVPGYTDIPDGEGLSLSTDMTTVVKAMAAPDSGLDVRDRMWLKITIPNAFIGKFNVVIWLLFWSLTFMLCPTFLFVDLMWVSAFLWELGANRPL